MNEKAASEFSEEEKKWMDTVAVNYVIAQSDGFQLGYAQAISDFSECIVNYWEGSDDKPQRSVLDTLVVLGVALRKRKETAERNIKAAKDEGYDSRYLWEYRRDKEAFGQSMRLFTKDLKEHGREEHESV